MVRLDAWETYIGDASGSDARSLFVSLAKAGGRVKWNRNLSGDAPLFLRGGLIINSREKKETIAPRFLGSLSEPSVESKTEWRFRSDE